MEGVSNHKQKSQRSELSQEVALKSVLELGFSEKKLARNFLLELPYKLVPARVAQCPYKW